MVETPLTAKHLLFVYLQHIIAKIKISFVHTALYLIVPSIRLAKLKKAGIGLTSHALLRFLNIM